MEYYTFDQVGGCTPPQEVVDDEKVKSLVQSMIHDGWKGAPLLYYDEWGEFITGSHRLAAIRRIAEMWRNREFEYDPQLDDRIYKLLTEEKIAVDVSDYIIGAFKNYYEVNGEYPELEYDNLGWMFEGTPIEQWKDEIVEW